MEGGSQSWSRGPGLGSSTRPSVAGCGESLCSGCSWFLLRPDCVTGEQTRTLGCSQSGVREPGHSGRARWVFSTWHFCGSSRTRGPCQSEPGFQKRPTGLPAAPSASAPHADPVPPGEKLVLKTSVTNKHMHLRSHSSHMQERGLHGLLPVAKGARQASWPGGPSVLFLGDSRGLSEVPPGGCSPTPAPSPRTSEALRGWVGCESWPRRPWQQGSCRAGGALAITHGTP